MNKKKSLAQRAFALVMALVLAMGLVPTTAWASTLDYKTATLQIALDADNDGKNDLVVNKSYRFVGEKTLDDLFAAAVAAGDIIDYEFSGDYLSSVTVTNGLGGTNKADYSFFWSGYVNGATDMTGGYVKQGSAITDGETISFGYEGYPSGPEEVDWSSTPVASVSDYFIGELTTGATLQLGYDADADGQSEIVLNKVYGFKDGATLGDLFAAAKAAGDIKDYVFEDSGYGAYLVSVTLADGTEVNNGPSYSSYWASYTNGDYNNAPKQTDALKDGTKYQFDYTKLDGSVQAADWSKAAQPAVSTAVAKKDGYSGDSDDADKAAANKYDAEKTALLLENLAPRFKKGCADASITNSYFEAAVALNQLGMGSQLDADAIVANLEKSIAAGNFISGTYGKYILALTAAGVDCTNITFSDGSVHNAVEEMGTMVDNETPYIYGMVSALPVYQSYADNSGRETRLIDAILDAQSDAGLFGATGWEDTQTTAQAIVALLPYRDSRTDVKEAIEKAVDALYDMQNEDGGFAYSKKGTASNLDATSAIIVALTSLGYDCAEGKDLTTSNGSSPLGWLVAQADQDSLDGFTRLSNWDETMSAATALLALTADAQFNANGSFAAYKLKTVTGGGEEQAKKAEEVAETAKKGVPSTGDESVTGVAVLAITVVGGAVIVEARRRRNAA